MRVICNKEMGTITLYPLAPSEKEWVEYLPTTVKIGQMLKRKSKRQTETRLVLELAVGD